MSRKKKASVAILRCLCSSHLRRLLGVKDRAAGGGAKEKKFENTSRAAMTVQCRHQSGLRGRPHEAIVRFEPPLPPIHSRSLFFVFFTDTFKKRRGRWGTLVRGSPVSYANTPMSAQQRDSPFQVASTPGPFVCLAGSAGFGHGHHGQGGELIVLYSSLVSGMYVQVCTSR